MASSARTANAASKLVAGFPSSGVVAPVLAPSAKPAAVKDEAAKLSTTDAMRWQVLRNATGGLRSVKQRYAHTDVRFPNFDAYRVESTKLADKPARETEDDRRGLNTAVVYGVGGMVTLLAARNVLQTVVYYKAMAADQRALASIEIDMNKVPEGQTKTFEWRGKPVFVKHRTQAEIQRERSVNVSDLRHPQSDEERVQKAEWSVVIGVCTHLGCVPIAGAGDFGGYYCPCHGSHYDASGRIRKGPAPLNLHVPAYSFKGDVIVVGSS